MSASPPRDPEPPPPPARWGRKRTLGLVLNLAAMLAVIAAVLALVLYRGAAPPGPKTADPTGSPPVDPSTSARAAAMRAHLYRDGSAGYWAPGPGWVPAPQPAK